MQGAAGAQGQQGPVGPEGPIGPVGPVGAQGAQGAPGAQGGSGQPGAVGPVGPVGAQGIPGVNGSTGPTGAPGAPGAVGAPGTAGSTQPDNLLVFSGFTDRIVQASLVETVEYGFGASTEHTNAAIPVALDYQTGVTMAVNARVRRFAVGVVFSESDFPFWRDEVFIQYEIRVNGQPILNPFSSYTLVFSKSNFDANRSATLSLGSTVVPLDLLIGQRVTVTSLMNNSSPLSFRARYATSASISFTPL